MEQFDLGIIGGGPAGYTAALHAAAGGEKSCAFLKKIISAVFALIKGCIPTKSILHASETFHKLQTCEDCGIKVENIQL